MKVCRDVVREIGGHRDLNCFLMLIEIEDAH